MSSILFFIGKEVINVARSADIVLSEKSVKRISYFFAQRNLAKYIKNQRKHRKNHCKQAHVADNLITNLSLSREICEKRRKNHCKHAHTTDNLAMDFVIERKIRAYFLFATLFCVVLAASFRRGEIIVFLCAPCLQKIFDVLQ